MPAHLRYELAHISLDPLQRNPPQTNRPIKPIATGAPLKIRRMEDQIDTYRITAHCLTQDPSRKYDGKLKWKISFIVYMLQATSR